MNETKDRYEFILKSPIDYTRDGLIDKACVVDLVAPSKKLLRKTYRLQQYLLKAVLQAQEAFKNMIDDDESSKKDSELDGKKMMSMLLASSIDIEECINEFEKIALLGAVEVENNIINKNQLDQIDPSDMEGLMANYMANFIMSLVMKNFKSS